MAAFVNIGSSIAGNDWVCVDGEWKTDGKIIPRFAHVSPNPRMWEIAKKAVRDSDLERVVFFSTDMMSGGQGRLARQFDMPTLSIISSPAYYHSDQDLPEHLEPADYAQALDTYRRIVAQLLVERPSDLKRMERYNTSE